MTAEGVVVYGVMWVQQHNAFEMIYIIKIIGCTYFSGFGLSDLKTLPVGVALPLWDSIVHCQSNPPPTWPQEAYDIIGGSHDHKKFCS